MDILNPNTKSGIRAATGKLLIAEPFLLDPHFARSVILLCEHGPNGSIGFVLNKPSLSTIDQLLPELSLPSLSVFSGGPVQKDNLHLIHRIPKLMGGIEINPGLFWGGSYQDLAGMSTSPKFRKDNVRLFSGYAGWDAGQLEEELQQGSWIVANAAPEIIFEVAAADAWSSSLRTLGPNFAYLANLPLHPQMN